jgi:hypothetical protein
MSNNPYANKVIENKIESLLSTKVDLSAYFAVDRSLEASAGMSKTVNKYKAAGNVEDLAQGNGNSGVIEAGYAGTDYTVGVTQGKGQWFDEEAMKDPTCVDAIVNGAAEIMQNDFTTKAIAQAKKFEKGVECDFSTSTSGYFFGKFVDAIAELGEEAENLIALANPADIAYIRKQLGQSLQYVEGFVRTGYIGTVCGVPIIMTKACPAGCMPIFAKEAITLFLKKGVEVEQDRDPDLRKNLLYIRKVALVAMTDANKIVGLAKAQSTACAITTYTKDAKTIAGTCGTDCRRVHVIDGDGKHYDAVPESGAWTVTADANLTTGDKINATAFADGKVSRAATEVTVA